MGFLDNIKSALGGGGGRLDVAKTYQLDRHSFTGTMSKFRVGTKIGTRDRYGIKFIDQEKLDYFEDRFKGLNKPPEGEIAMKFDHPRIVKTLEYGQTTTGQQYILMEYLDGPGLDLVIRERNPDVIPHQLTLIRHMAQALMEVHSQGFIHRDVCPRNFICSKDLTGLKLIDFGLTLPDEPPYRMPGNRTGTPQYMAPEIVRRRQTDQRLDLFAFGVTAYRLLTFEHPWGSTDHSGTAALAHDTKPMIDIREHRPNLDPQLIKAVHKCLAVKVEERMDTFKRFLAGIGRITSADVK
jgi:serine/threonine-protein kinase